MGPLDELIEVLGTGTHGAPTMLETLPLTVYLTAVGGGATPRWISRQSEEMFGYDAASWLEPGFLASIVHPDDREAAIGLRQSAEGWTGEYRIVAADGRTLRVRDEARLVRAASGDPAYLQGSLIDVTVANAEVHRKQEARYRSLLESMPVAMYRSSENDLNASEYMSERAVAMFGYPVEAWSDPAFFATVLHPDDRDWVLAENELELTTDDSIWVSEYRLITADGRTVWVRDESWTVRDEDGNHQQGCMIDVSEQKAAEAKLAEALASLRTAEEEYRLLVEELPMAVYTDRPDETATSTYISPRVETMFGYPRERWMESTFFASVLHPDDRERMITTAADAIHGGDARVTSEYRLIAADGRIVWVRDDQWIVRDDRGEPLHLQGFMIDITEQHEAALEIRRQKQHFESLVEISPVAVIITDRDERITAWNPAATRLFGYEAGEAIGRTLNDTVIGPEQEGEGDDVSREASETGRAQRITRRTRQDGSLVDVEMLMVALVIEGEHSGYYVIYHDISELQHALREAEAATQAKSAFLATMSHEIRTPMNAIIGMSGLLLETELTDEQHEFAETLQTSGDALLTVINDVLDFSKIEAGRVDLEAEPFSLTGCVESALDVLARTASAKGIELVYSLAPDLPETIVGDAGRLRQIVLNLLSNAVKFTSAGEVVLTVDGRSVEQGASAVGGRWEIAIEVRDTGIGIPPDRIGHLFESFSQADASITRRFGGTGLGLAISRRLAEAMDGSISAESSGVPGEGSTFRLTIQADAAPDAERTASAAAARVELDGKRVLVVDDNDTNRRILRAQLDRFGMQTDDTASPVDAYESLRRGASYDLLLLDFHMPGMDGLELAKRIVELDNPDPAPVVILTSFGLTSSDLELAPISASLTKPVRPSALHDTIVSIFAGGTRTARPRAARSAMDGQMGARLPLNILVAEDNPVNQKLLLRLLERHGYSADVVEDGRQAVAAVANGAYDLVLMDVQMPEMDGIEATRRILAEHPAGGAPRIAALTANALAGDRAMCLAAGMDDYLSKPIRPEELVAALERAAEARPAG